MRRLYAPTIGTRIAVWLFPLTTIAWGLVYLLAPDSRMQSSVYSVAVRILPMPTWGAVFLGLGAMKLACLAWGHGRGFIVAMCAGMGLYTWWAFLYTAAVFSDPHTSPGAPIWPVVFVLFHAATLATLTRERG